MECTFTKLQYYFRPILWLKLDTWIVVHATACNWIVCVHYHTCPKGAGGGGGGGIPPMSHRSLTPNHLRGSKLGGKGNFGDSLWFRKFSPLWILTRGHVCTLLFIYFLKKKLFILARWLNVCLWCFDNSGRKILASIVVKVFLLLEYVLRYSV